MSTLGDRLYEHRLAERFCDFELIPSDSTIGIKCHKLVLMASSEYFSCMFSSGMRESSARSVTLADCRSEVLTMLIDFFYKSERPQGVTGDNVLELFSWALRCDLHELSVHCWDFIRDSLGPDNLFSVLSFAIAHHLNEIEEECILLIQIQFALLDAAEEWMDLSYETLKDILSYKTLGVLHGDHVLEILIRWIQQHSDHKDLLGSVNVDNLSQAALKKYNDFLQSINYVPAEPTTRHPSFHVHFMHQYESDMRFLAVVCVTNKHVGVWRYPDLNISESDRREHYRVECCTTHKDGIVVGACRNMSVFSYNYMITEVQFSENLQIPRNKEDKTREEVVLDVASIHDYLWALIADPIKEAPRLVCYLPPHNFLDMENHLPPDVHRVLDNSFFPRVYTGIYVLRRCGGLMRAPFDSLGQNHDFVDCEGLVIAVGRVLVHGKDSAGDFWTSCYDEKEGWKPSVIRLFHDQTLDDEEVLSYKLFLEDTKIYLVEEWSTGFLTLYQWAPQDVCWNMLKVFREPGTRFIGPVRRNDCDADK